MRGGVLILVLAATPVLAQQDQRAAWYAPVDQAVGDWNANSRSQRVVDPGNAQFSDRVSMFRPLNPYQYDPHGNRAAHSYILHAPGVRAWVSNPEYLSLVTTDPVYPEWKFNVSPVVDGAYLTVIPAGAVFDLTLPTNPPTAMDLNPHLDRRVDKRVNLRVDYRLPASQRTMPPPIVGFGDAVVLDPSTPAPPRVTRPMLRDARTGTAPPQDSPAADEQVVDEACGADPAGDQRDDARGE